MPEAQTLKQTKLTSIQRFLAGCSHRRHRTVGLGYPSGIRHAAEDRSYSSWPAGQILDPGSRRPVMGSMAAGGSLDAEAVAAGHILEGGIGCSPEAGCTVDRCRNHTALTSCWC